jgi:hypothetical protein
MGSLKRLPMKNEATPKNAKQLVQETTVEKNRQPKKTQRGSVKSPSMKKEATLKIHKGARSKDL